MSDDTASSLAKRERNVRTLLHGASDPGFLQTHISWIVLDGEFAYKIKKPVTLDFLDFASLEMRRHYCEEELRLNRPWAPDLYLDVVPVTQDGQRWRIGGDGRIVEYALRMRRFDQDLRLDRQLELGRLSIEDMRELGEKIGGRHEQAPIVDPSRRERVLSLTASFMRDNFAALDGQIDARQLAAQARWTDTQLELHEALFGARFDAGCFRDCHGDLHLGNLVRLDSGITAFDCIEFSDDLRHIDVQCDVAFLLIDLVARRRHDLASHFYNRYLERSGDYAGVALLSLFFVYRCLVRAKVAGIRAQEAQSVPHRELAATEAQFYCDMATRQIGRRPPVLVVMHGFSGSGKTWVSGQLMAALPAIRIRSDVERRRLHGLGEREASGAGIGEGIYDRSGNRGVYARMHEYARTILDAGHDVILDASYLDADERDRALRLADACGRRAVIVDVTASEDVLESRIEKREVAGSDASEAGLAVLAHQRDAASPLTDAERKLTVSFENRDGADVAPLVESIRDANAR